MKLKGRAFWCTTGSYSICYPGEPQPHTYTNTEAQSCINSIRNKGLFGESRAVLRSIVYRSINFSRAPFLPNLRRRCCCTESSIGGVLLVAVGVLFRLEYEPVGSRENALRNTDPLPKLDPNALWPGRDHQRKSIRMNML